MDDMLALDGGSAARNWQKRHLKRKQRDEMKRLAAITRTEAKADLAKRLKKWKAKVATAKAQGLPPVSLKSRPRILNPKRHNLIDMTGRRFGRLMVIRIAPTSKNSGSRNRRWWVKCDCGTAERMVAGTNLRQGLVKSCGCLRDETSKANWVTGTLGQKKRAREQLLAKPIPQQLVALKRKFKASSQEAKLIAKARNLIIAYELKLGLRKAHPGGWKTDRYKIPTLH